jgi:hypothetical protein
MEKRLETESSDRNQDITGLSFVAAYLVLAFLIVCAWDYLLAMR